MHCTGDITIWHLPSLRIYRKILLDDQPGFDDVNPILLRNPKLKRKKKYFLKNPLRWMPTTVRWWDACSIVVGRYSGGVAIMKVVGEERNQDDFGELKNILGDSCEFFQAPLAFSKCFDNGFFVLESEISTKRQEMKSIIEERSEEEDLLEEERFSEEGSSSEEEDEDTTIFVRGKRALGTVAYLITESERFAPPRKRPRLLMRSFKLLSLISTTPEELYARKIEMEEYGEALIMAQHYGLDSDHVYDRQWRLSNLSVLAIKDYLGKVKRRSLVLRECLNTVPNDVDAVRDLLNYGLMETGLDVLVRMGQSDSDEAKFIFAHEHIQDANDYQSYYISEEEFAAKAEQKENELMDLVSWPSLTLGQKELLSKRKTLLKYLHRLESYLAIIDEDEGDFDRKFYIRYRDQPILKSAIEFARSGQVSAVATVLERYGSELKNYHLVILSNFPESLCPDDYYELIPKVDNHNSGKVLMPQPKSTQDVAFRSNRSNPSDWSQYDFVKKHLQSGEGEATKDADVSSTSTTTSAFSDQDHNETAINDKRSSLRPKFYFGGNAPSRELLAKWIHRRVRDIESESSLVDYALSLLQIASGNGIQVDPRLHHNMLTLEMMMYELHHLGPSTVTSLVSLRRLEDMSDLEIVDKLMGNSTKVNFMNNVNRILIPYVDRLESLEAGARTTLLRNYLLHMSATSLTLPFELIKHGAATTTSSNSGIPNQPGHIFMSAEEYISIGIDCIYAFEANDSNWRPTPDVDDDDGGDIGGKVVSVLKLENVLAGLFDLTLTIKN